MERNLSFPREAVSRVRTKLTWAQLEIVTAPVDELRLLIAGDDDSVEELRTELESQELTIAQPQLAYAKEILPRRRWLQICLRLPESWRGELDVSNIAGMVGAHKLTGEEIALTTVSGRILADGLSAGSLSLRTVSGSVAGGDLTAQRAHFRTVSGKMSLTGLRLTKTKASTVSGDVRLSLREGGRSLDLQSVSGSFAIEVEGPVKAAMHALSGQLIVSDGIAEAPECLEISASSVSGNLVVRGWKDNG